MNAIIALCHFCDSHGPKTLFCTQAYKYSDLINVSSASASFESDAKNDANVSNKMELDIQRGALSNMETVLSAAPPKAFSPDFTSLNRRQVNASSTSSNISDSSISSCKACSTNGASDYISYNTDDWSESTATEEEFDASHLLYLNNQSMSANNICYISRSKPSDSEVYAIVRNACIRTLHCEVFEDPIYFDDDKDGSVIGYEFHIKDIEGRGHQRSYSLVTIMKDRIYLQHLWSFLSTQMAIIAENIKKEAQLQFDKEIKASPINTHLASPSASSNLLPGVQANNRSNLFKTKKTKPIRGLAELTGDSMIFAKLHMWFTWILRMSSCQISEDVIHGPLSEDIQVKIEREQQLSEFIKLETVNSGISSANANSTASNNKSQSHNSIDELENDFKLNSDFKDVPVRGSMENESTKIELNEYDLETENELMLMNFHVETLRELIQLLGKETFHKIAYNITVGNQVIIHGKYENLVSSIIRTFEELIPLGCCQTVYYSSEYIKSYQCKLLGISDKVLPNPMNDEDDERMNLFGDLNEFIYLKISFNLKSRDREENANMNMEMIRNAMTLGTYEFNDWLELINKQNHLIFDLHTNISNINQVPSVLSKIEGFLFNEKLEDKSVSCLIKLAKEEWLNKTKVFYKYMRSPLVNDLNQNGNEGASNRSLESVLKILNLEKKDELALKFWQAGLSNECKVQIRTV